MRPRHLVAVGVVLIAGVAPGVLASVSVPTSTAVYQEVVVSNGHLASGGVSYTVVSSTTTGFTANLVGSLLLHTVSAGWNGEASQSCVIGLYNLGTNSTPVTCTGYTHPNTKSSTLTITVT